MLRVAAALLVAPLAFSCSTSAQQGCRTPVVSDEMEVALERRADNALIIDATVTLAQAAPVYVEYGNAGIGWLRTPTSASDVMHRIPLLRLRAETTYQARAFALGESGCPSIAAASEFSTDPLPAMLRVRSPQASGKPSLPLVMADHRPTDNRPQILTSFLVVFDAQGQPVWYYTLPPEMDIRGLLRTTISAIAVTQRDNGNFLYLSSWQGFEEITPDGNVVRRVRPKSHAASLLHHDFAVLPDGRLLFLGEEERTVPEMATIGQPTQVIGDTLHTLNWETEAEETVWSTFDVLEPLVRPEHWRYNLNKRDDWTHSNSLTLGPRGNVVISVRHLDQVISLSPDFKTVEWRLGGLDSSFAFPDASDRFYGQHTATELPGGRVLLFDNGIYRPDGEYSRALELELDFATMTARKVWEYRARPQDLYARWASSAFRLANGNTFINFGGQGGSTSAPGMMVEARTDGTPAWEHLTKWASARAFRYRAQPLTSIGGETSVEPTSYGEGPRPN